MRLARFIVIIVLSLGFLGSILASNLAKYNGQPVWHSTFYIIRVTNGVTYATYGSFCTQTGTTVFSSSTGVLSTVSKTTAGLPPTNVVGTATNGLGFTTSILTYQCITGATLVTFVN
ncbi:hypothetical protein Cpin_3202 [Chitinophaga pinensis DSM 2588]|uniref:Uncharacterized protein n=1 Tax=Chitinophaga pinensis (strain ATCC 43595 / DSM 2588 / LMG 13176 / NBRC 15968 / NCIMB 11800 / UQM 2034) TaxID=485918 RepID=A0A979G4I6_CHIPD|nr:hypothetical protein Cpin_3202 [Chitinophaga pinensis DSM 2588]